MACSMHCDHLRETFGRYQWVVGICIAVELCYVFGAGHNEAEIPWAVLDVLGPSGLIAQVVVVVQGGLGPPGIGEDIVVGLQAGSAD